ncbi:MAG: hypothetical protein WC756_12110 [Taibaiella sp.]|jgi:hypothetical protein
MTVSDIKKALHWRFANFDYELSESYIFKHDWESDFFVISKSGYAYEVEIKLTRSDYRADFKKQKHLIFSNIKKSHYIINNGLGLRDRDYVKNGDGQYVLQELGPHTRIEIIDNSKVIAPNKFYYAVPEGLIAPSEVPAYSGLIYVHGHYCTVVKEAPFLHKRKLDLQSTLLKKFYYECIRHRITIENFNRKNKEF